MATSRCFGCGLRDISQLVRMRAGRQTGLAKLETGTVAARRVGAGLWLISIASRVSHLSV